MAILDEDGNDLTRFRKINKYLREHRKNVVALPWENQAEYAKLQRAKVLIGAHLPLEENAA